MQFLYSKKTGNFTPFTTVYTFLKVNVGENPIIVKPAEAEAKLKPASTRHTNNSAREYTFVFL